ncbi:MAG: hypothetical protein HC859_05715 [Bacteroidia bacterium]|nr:hypothetical protein [Bacteroidia bacterium]
MLMVYVESAHHEVIEVELQDINGLSVHESSVVANSEIEINAALAPGVYILRASSQTVNKWIRVLKIE